MFHLITELEGNDYFYINMSYYFSALCPRDSLFCVKKYPYYRQPSRIVQFYLVHMHNITLSLVNWLFGQLRKNSLVSYYILLAILTTSCN